MQALQLLADWQPKANYPLNSHEQTSRKVQSGSAVWKNPRLNLSKLPDPELTPDEVLIQVAAVGICGSDMHMYEADSEGYILYPGLTRFPNILGHEFSGRIVELGKEVRDLAKGDLVTVEEIQWCGFCDACRKGLVNHCTQMEELGFTTPGAMAELIAVKAKYCWKITELAERLGDEKEALLLAAMVEPTGVSYHAMFNRISTWKPGITVWSLGAPHRSSRHCPCQSCWG
ncbi:MAG: alcohol dehydrogenase catalytic domain-containing protein [Deinococcales bacterium]